MNSLTAEESADGGVTTYTIRSLTEDGDVISSYVWNGSEPNSYMADSESVSLTNAPSSLLEFQKIVGQYIAENYYGKESVTYTFDDRQIEFVDAKTPSVQYETLGNGDYYIKKVEYNYAASAAVYDGNKMKFSASPITAFSDDDVLCFYVYKDGSAERTPAALYRLSDATVTILDSCVSSLSSSQISFAPESNVTGYAVETSNKYYYVSLVTYPEVVLKDSDTVKERFNKLKASGNKKLGVKNTGTWKVKAHSDDTLYDNSVSGTDYIAEVTRTSTIRKSALDEDTRITGKDGNSYKTGNDSLNRQYTVAWKTDVYEQMDDGTRVPQQSGIFYDLLPEHSEIIRDSINIYIDGKAVPSAISYIDTVDNYNGSNQTLLIIKVDAECQKGYTLTYATSHSYENIQDYGNMALNTVVYRTGNANLGGSYADDGGNHAVTNSDTLTGLATNPQSSDEKLGITPAYDGTSKKFIYAEATEQMLALIQTSSGIYKKVSTVSDPTYRKSGTVSINENYKYNIRMKNSASTKARDIAILDSIENFGDGINYGGTRHKGWGGTIQSIDLSGVQEKMDKYFDTFTFPAGVSAEQQADAKKAKIMLYVSDDESDIVNLEGHLYSDATDRQALLKYLLGETDTVTDTAVASKWKVVDDWSDLTNNGQIDLSKVTAFIVYTGKYFTLGKGESLSFNVTMKAPDEDVNTYDNVTGYITKPKTYNNVYRSFTNVPIITDSQGKEVEGTGTYFYTHYDNTELELATVGTLEFSKTDSDTGAPLEGVTFSLSGISAYGNAYNETLVSDPIGKVVFENLEIGTYKLIETLPDENHMPDPAERTVVVSRTGEVTVYKIYDSDDADKCEEIDKVDGKYVITNIPRYHGDISFLKRDSRTTDGVQGALFRFTGTSLLGENYDLTAESNLNGTVTFTDIEPGTYELTEIRSPDNYEPNIVKYTVTVKEGSNYGISYTISGYGAGKSSGTPYIDNVPTGKLVIHKADSFTKDNLKDAVFRLTAPSSLNNDIRSLVDDLTVQYKAQYMLNDPDADENSIPQSDIDKYVRWKWDSTNNVWYQNYEDHSADAYSEGEFNFCFLLEGSGYTLEEITAPSGHKNVGTPYTFDVAWDSSNKIFDIDFSATTNLEYVKMGDKTYVTTSEYADSLFVRVNNTPTYEDDKVIYKSWIGDPYTTNFPVVHLGAEVTQQPDTYVTIKSSGNTDKDLRRLISSHRTEMTGFNKATLDEFNTAQSSNNTFREYTETVEGETGHFYAWWDASDNKVKWYATDATVVYLPADCSFLFSECNNSSFTSVDLSPFNFEKVEKMQKMFDSCKYLQSIDMSTMINTPKLYSCWNMFAGCTALESMDLSNWLTTSEQIPDNYALSLRSMFQGSSSLKSVLIPNLTTTKMGNMRQMFCNVKDIEKVVLGKSISFVNFAPQNAHVSGENSMSDSETDRSLNGMFYSWGVNTPATTTTLIIDFSGIDTSNVKNLDDMFNSCKSLKTVYVSDKWSTENVTSTKYVFSWNIENLVGGKGTRCYNSGKYSKEYAKIDGGTTSPGYFTDINDLEAALVAQGDTLAAWRSRSTVTTSGTQGTQSQKLLSKLTALSSTALRAANIDTSNNYTKGFDETAVTNSVYGAGFTVDPEKSFEPTTTEINKEEGANYLPIVNYSYEYITDKGGAITAGTTSYSVDETINLTVTVTTYADSATDGKMTETVNKYYYTKTIANGAAWTEVSTDTGSQWKLTMSVNDADEDFFIWEDDISGYTSDARASDKRKTQGSNDEPVIGNTQSGQKVGSISITKKLSATDSNKYNADQFWVKVTVTTDGSKPYTKKPFDSNGVAYYQLAAGETITISSIPEGYHYDVEECSDTEHPMPQGYSFNSITFSPETKTVSSTAKSIVTVTNNVLTQNITASKDALLNVVDAAGKAYTGDVTAEQAALQNEDFAFNITFNGLIMGKTYNYKIINTSDGTVIDSSSFVSSADSDETTLTPPVTLKSGQKVVFEDIPQQTRYTVTEAEPSVSDTKTSYSAVYTINGGTAQGGYSVPEQTLDGTSDTIGFTNTKTITKDDSKVSITIKKEWYDTNGSTPLDPSDSAMPSFINVYLGRVLRYEVNGETYYTDQLDSYKMAVLNSSGNWEVTYDDLPKTAKVKAGTQNGVPVEYQGTYIYYVSEASMFLFENSQEKADSPAVTFGDNKYYFVKYETDPQTYTYTLNNQKKEIEELTVSKTVSGNFGNKARKFNFTVWLYDESGAPVTNVTGIRATFKVNGAVSRNRTYTLTGSNSIDISLSHNESVTFYLPDKTIYTVAEDDYSDDGYVTTSTLNGEASADPLKNSGQIVKGTKTTVAYINAKEGTVPTGIKTTAYAAAFAALICAIYLNLKKRKRYKDEEI